jgi:hypothetical protein
LLGFSLGIISLTRPSSLILILVVGVYLLIKRRRLSITLIPVLVAILVISLWILKAFLITGKFVFINYVNSYNFFLSNNEYSHIYKNWYYGSYIEYTKLSKGFGELVQEIKKLPFHLRGKEYLKNALGHIFSRPDLFILRSLNRIRFYFAFDNYTSALLYRFYRTGPSLSISVALWDAYIYINLMLVSIFSLFIRWSSEKTTLIRLILLIGMFYAIPYFFSLSHPVYHFPIIPLFAVICGLCIYEIKRNPGAIIPLLKYKGMRFTFIISLIIFAIIQIEWLIIQIIHFYKIIY